MIEILRNKSGKQYLRTKARNGRIIWMLTKAVSDLKIALYALQNLITALNNGVDMQIKKAASGQWYGVIDVAGIKWKSSEQYKTQQGLEKGFESLKNNL